MKKVIMGIFPGKTSPSMFEVDFDLSKMQIRYVKNEGDLESLIIGHTCLCYPECVEEYFTEACAYFLGRQNFTKIKDLLKVYNQPIWFESAEDAEEHSEALLNSLLKLKVQNPADYEDLDENGNRFSGDEGYDINPYTL